MIILGISALYHDASACISVNGKLMACVQEERFTRVKNDASFPINSIQYSLSEAGVKLGEVDVVVFYDKPLLKFERILEVFLSTVPFGWLSFIINMPIWIKEKMFFKKLLKDKLKQIGDIDWGRTKLLFSEHHLSHAASSFFPSQYNDAAILTLDGVGEWTTTSIAHGKAKDIKVIEEISFPHSVGLFYSSFTFFLGFKVNSGEYKLMGLAPYGYVDSKETKKFVQIIKSELIDIKSDGSYQLHHKNFQFISGTRMCNPKKWEKLFGLSKRNESDSISQSHCNLALAIQKVTEEVVIGLAKRAKEVTGSRNLCLSGGVALNCVANGVLQKIGLFDNIFVQPASGDAGGSLGAVLAVSNIYFKQNIEFKNLVFLGPSFSNEEIEKDLKFFKAVFEKVSNIEEVVAKEINNQKVIGWFQGRMEFGPRALGNRSILGDPINKGMQQKINLKIKYREGFRPFAPSILKEDSSRVFELENDSPFMLFVCPLKDEFKGSRKETGVDSQLAAKNCVFPAITHVDNSARVQTVEKAFNPRYHKLLEEVRKLNGYGMVINTSFNVRGEPIVLSPKDAYSCFMDTDMDMLAVGDYLLYKEGQPKWEHKRRFKND